MRSSYDPGNMHFPNPYEGRAPPPGRLDLSSTSQHRPLSHRASSEPTGHELYPPQISPHAMAQPRSIHSPDLFFTRTPTYAAQHVHRARSYTPTHQHAQPLPPRSYSHDQDEYHERPPPVPPHYGAPVRSAPPPPPPPPKPTAPYQQSPYFPSISPTQSSPRSPHPIAPSAPLAPVSEDSPESPTDQDELRQVIELSQQESARRRQYLNELSQQEEDELARALEASKLQSNNRNSSARDHVGVTDSAAALGPSSAVSGPSRPTITTTE
ncbi:uncharacterized protein SCHCODRAFT_02472780, partial [Schizophyllum commune H4-8]|uniref:uncharacterized protein n=1 Tax=Schizophyllum commune (strain H4-8 / FGSC 9210) TaxID=578458 RepID=UPI00215DE4F9